MSIEEKEARLRELFRQKDAVTAEIHALLGGASAHLTPVKEKRKYKKRDKSATAPKPAKKGGKPCCGSLGRKHKNGCDKARHLGGEGKLPPDEKTWRCVVCDHLQESASRPEECSNCSAKVFVSE